MHRDEFRSQPRQRTSPQSEIRQGEVTSKRQMTKHANLVIFQDISFVSVATRMSVNILVVILGIGEMSWNFILLLGCVSLHKMVHGDWVVTS
ncbi:uncharacterized protein BDW47DRAFT_110373 [Aspergillus candidus]|uniref:Uncharacterized protein n=1 Tax=Aspergillus candidus TaxID=41067 RepID=A0A2I2F486_ASPCN|nr:hypothetical protein BDW47DRAFT_110373 [Aspergillus candidus]PLB35459.1 hypothetical protein BDW47DRAFT_110373 [Aspergillus candidus]